LGAHCVTVCGNGHVDFWLVMSMYRNLCGSCKSKFHLCCYDFPVVACGDCCYFLCYSMDPVPSIYYTVCAAKNVEKVRIRGRKRIITL